MYKKRISAFFLCFLLCLTSCSQHNDGGKQKLKEVLYGNFTADITYAFSSEDTELSGEAKIIKEDTGVTVEFLTPEALAGVTAQSGEDGLGDTLTFEYYGMRIPLPQGALTKMNLLLSLFSGDTASAVTELPDTAILPISEELSETENGIEPDSLRMCTVPLSCGGEALLIFDSNSGYPVSFSAKTENIGVHGRISEWKTLS